MKKNILKFFVCIIILVIIITVIFMVSKTENENNPENEILSQKILLKDKTVKYENSTQQVDLVIPEIQNLEGEYITYINSKMYNDLSYENVYQDTIEGYESGEIGFFTYETNYERYNCGDYLSIVVNQYIHLGYNRPRIQKKCYIVDTNREVTPTLMDLFEDKINYKNAIIAEINQQAKDKEIELVGGNGLKSLSDLQTFYIKDNQLILYFESSEIAAAAVGQLEFTMPFELVDGKFIIED